MSKVYDTIVEDFACEVTDYFEMRQLLVILMFKHIIESYHLGRSQINGLIKVTASYILDSIIADGIVAADGKVD